MLSMSSMFNHNSSNSKRVSYAMDTDDPPAFDDEEYTQGPVVQEEQAVRRVQGQDGRPEWVPWAYKDDDGSHDDMESHDQVPADEPSVTGGSSVNDVSEEQAMTEDIYSLMSTVSASGVSRVIIWSCFYCVLR